jgi:hypothetical protein
VGANKSADQNIDKYLKYREPGFLIIGSQKGGTSSLYHHLCQHPNIRSARRKEIHFFDDNYHKGINWYESHFPPVKLFRNMITGEASPYYLFHPHVPWRVWSLYPRIKLIILLRNPVDRAYSHYHHNRRKNREKRSFEEAISKEPGLLAKESEKFTLNREYKSYLHKHLSYLSRGIYIRQLKNWLEYYPEEQFLILKSEDFFRYPKETMANIFSFLGIEYKVITNFIQKNHYAYPPMNPVTRQKLVDIFEPFNSQLMELLGQNFRWEEIGS